MVEHGFFFKRRMPSCHPGTTTRRCSKRQCSCGGEVTRSFRTWRGARNTVVIHNETQAFKVPRHTGTAGCGKNIDLGMGGKTNGEDGFVLRLT